MDFYCAAPPPKKNGRRKKAHVKVLPTLGQPGEDLLAAPGRKPLVRFEAAPRSELTLDVSPPAPEVRV